MANVTNKNPWVLDTAGVLITSGNVVIAAIVVVANADTWSVVVHDKSGGDIVFQFDSNIADHRGVVVPLFGTKVTGFYLTTLTDVARILVYKL